MRTDPTPPLILASTSTIVVDGKTVGKILAPAGAETRLVAIQSGKLGLEFRGGGSWVSPDETDLSEQLRKSQR